MYGKGGGNGGGTKQTGSGKKPRLGEDYGWSEGLVPGPTNSSTAVHNLLSYSPGSLQAPEQSSRDLKHLI